MDSSTGAYVAVIANKRGLTFFEFGDAGLNIKKGIFGGQPMIDQTSVCSVGDSGKYISGAINGSIYIWQGNQCQKTVNIHQGAIHCVNFMDGKLLTSGYGDQLLKVIDANEMTEEQAIKLPSYARSIDMKNGVILVGTRDGQICTIQNKQVNVVINGHQTGETWGLAIDENTGIVITAGDDNKILAFDTKKNKVVS